MNKSRELAEALVKKLTFNTSGYNWAVDAVLEAFEMNPNVPSPSAQAAAQPTKSQVEFKVERFRQKLSFSEHEAPSDWLTRMHAEGWVLVAVDGGYHFFRREVAA